MKTIDLLSRDPPLALGPPGKWCGVYAIWSGERLLYIGQSANVRHRITRHLHRRGRTGATHATAFRCRDRRHALALESELIALYRPPLNRYREPPPGLASELVGVRRRARLTQAEAAALVYKPLRSWQNWEQASKGRRIPRYAMELLMLKAGQYTWLEPEGREDGQRRLRFDNGALIEVRNPGCTRE